MGILKKVFGRRESNQDEVRQATSYVSPDWISHIILAVPSGTKMPNDERLRKSFIRNVFRAVNPDMFKALKGGGDVRLRYYESDFIGIDGFIDGQNIHEPMDAFKVPPAVSSYIQSLRLEDERIVIRLQQLTGEVRENAVELDEPLTVEGGTVPAEAVLFTAYSCRRTENISSIWPMKPRPKNYDGL